MLTDCYLALNVGRKILVTLRLLDCKSELNHPNAVVSFVKLFGSLRYQNDHFWEVATELVLHNFKRLKNEHVKLDLLRGYAAAKRGSDEFWKYTVQHLMEESDSSNTFYHEPLLRDVTLAAIGLKLSLPATLMDYRGFKPASISARMEHLQGALPSTTSEDLAFLLLNHPECSKKHSDLFEENIGHNWQNIQPAQRISILKMFEAKGRPQYFEAGEQTADDGLTFGERIQKERADYEASLGPKKYIDSEIPMEDTREDRHIEEGILTPEEYNQGVENYRLTIWNEVIKHQNSAEKKIPGEFEFESDDQELLDEIPGYENMSPQELAEKVMILREREKREFLETKTQDLKDDSGEESEDEEDQSEDEAQAAEPTTGKEVTKQTQFQFNQSGKRRDYNDSRPDYRKQQQQQQNAKSPKQESPPTSN